MRERGQALVEYLLILVLVGLAFGFALAATGPVISNVFSNSIRDLLSQTEVGEIPGREDFWATVTAAKDEIPERSLPTNTPANPTTVPTAGPSPTPTQTFTPTTVPPSPTVPPTATPTDMAIQAPLYDSIENDTIDWWRSDSNLASQSSVWSGQFFTNTSFTGDPAVIFTVGTQELDFNGQLFSGQPNQNVSMRLRKTYNTPNEVSVAFTGTNIDDAIRVYINGTRVNLPNSDGDGFVRNRSFVGTGVFPAGSNEVMVEYVQFSGALNLQFSVSGAGVNPDDRAVTGSGYACQWQTDDDPSLNGNNHNTELYSWVLKGDDIAPNSRCYMEWRGSIEIPAGWTHPRLIFWDMWDFSGGNGTEAWLEVAEYVPQTVDNPDPDPDSVGLDRDAVNWERVSLRQNGTSNYNWTRNVVNLNNIGLGDNVAGRRLTFRFVMENQANNARRMWYVDDLMIDNVPPRTFALNQEWNFNDPTGGDTFPDAETQALDFVHTGGESNGGTVSGFNLVSNNKFGVSGYSWHDSVGLNDRQDAVAGNPQDYTRYKRHTESPDNISNFSQNNLRIHALEFNGWIDLTDAPLPDRWGNRGPRQLSFHWGAQVGSYTGLGVQWTTDNFGVGPANWTTFDDGELRSVQATGLLNSPNMREQLISLEGLSGNPNRIRIRFVMLVHGAAERYDGWWIDQIRLGREESPKWLDYPFFDDAQSLNQLPWNFVGGGGQTIDAGRKTTDEPDPEDNPDYRRASYRTGAYANNSRSSIVTRYPIDLLNDTTDKLIFGTANQNTNTAGAATHPVLSFYHRRDLAGQDNFLVEWRRNNGTDADWQPLWMYRYQMTTQPNSNNVRTARQLGWEYVEIDMRPIMAVITTSNDPGSTTEDDIILRFTVVADSSGTAQGVWVDDIAIQEHVELTFRLWPDDENRNEPVSGTSLGLGDGTNYLNEPDVTVDGVPWWESWYNGGDWHASNILARVGALGFHDSPINQPFAPTGAQQPPGSPPANSGWEPGVRVENDFGLAEWNTIADSFNALELRTIIDLRGVDVELERPVLFFWNRYDLGPRDRIMVQVSEEMTGSQTDIDTAMRNRCPNSLVQCYEQRRGWTPWQTRWEISGDKRTYSWQREQVDLSPFGYNDTLNQAGKRIRIRFVLDALDATSTDQSNNGRDGWYIDYPEIRFTVPPANVFDISSANFDDAALGMQNWIGEGSWGLSPLVFEGSGGGPASIGIWTVNWWTCTTCDNVNGGLPVGSDIFLQDPARRAPDRTEQVTQINYNNGNNGPNNGPWSFSNDEFVGEFRLETGVVGASGFTPGNRSFMTRSDDGVRIKVEQYVGGVLQVNTGPGEWNVLSNWTNHAPTTDMGTFNFVAGRSYRITMQYFENSGGSVITLTTGSGRFSYTDSPRLNASAIDARPLPYSNSSLILNGVLDMTNVTENEFVLMEYRTLYEMDGNTRARVEVSVDGGFNWTNNNLRSSVIHPTTGAVIIDDDDLDNATFGNTKETNNWRARQQNLTSYRGNQVMLRFRFDRLDSRCVDRDNSNCDDHRGNLSDRVSNNYYIGWWISRVRVVRFPIP